MAEHHKRMSKSIDWKEKSQNRNNQNKKHSLSRTIKVVNVTHLAEKIELKKSGVLPLGFNEHTKIPRSSNLTNLSVDQSIKSIIN